MMHADAPIRLLLGVTGSVATIKLDEIVAALRSSASKKNKQLEIKIVATKAATTFIDTKWELDILTDETEWKSWTQKGDDILHIELRRWADIFIIAPIGANTLAKLANGLCDNLLTCIARAWNFEKPMIVFPAMNTVMWKHPLTAIQINILEGFGIKVTAPVTKTLACGDTGMGALQQPADIANVVFQAL